MPDAAAACTAATACAAAKQLAQAIKEGAYDLITKPIKKAQFMRTVEKAAEKQYLSRENRHLRSQLSNTDSRRLVYAVRK
jgi:two-component system response regulator HydG